MSATKDKKQASANLKRAKKNLIEKINEVNDEALIEKIEKLISEDSNSEISDSENDFWELKGIWENREIDAQELREKANKRDWHGTD